jgi:hypothetical protein
MPSKTEIEVFHLFNEAGVFSGLQFMTKIENS